MRFKHLGVIYQLSLTRLFLWNESNNGRSVSRFNFFQTNKKGRFCSFLNPSLGFCLVEELAHKSKSEMRLHSVKFTSTLFRGYPNVNHS